MRDPAPTRAERPGRRSVEGRGLGQAGPVERARAPRKGASVAPFSPPTRDTVSHREPRQALGGGDQRSQAMISSQWKGMERRCPRVMRCCPSVVRRRGLGRVERARYPCCPGSIPVWPGIRWSQCGAGPGLHEDGGGPAEGKLPGRPSGGVSSARALTHQSSHLPSVCHWEGGHCPNEPRERHRQLAVGAVDFGV